MAMTIPPITGTFVGDQRVAGVRTLHDGEVVGVGSVKLTFSVLRALHSTETDVGEVG